MKQTRLILLLAVLTGSLLSGCSKLTGLIIINYTSDEVDIYINGEKINQRASPKSYIYDRVYLGDKLTVEARGIQSGREIRLEYLKSMVTKAVTEDHPEFIVELK